MEKNDTIQKLAKKLDYMFNDASLLITAVTHRSLGKNNNERLEYLGDAILGFIIAELLYQKYPTQPEGVLTRFRAMLVRGETLASLARNLDLGLYLKLGTGEKKSGGWQRDSILANAMEAIIGAMYLDSDLESCKRFVLTIYSGLLSELSLENLTKDPKTELQEYLQARQQSLPLYKIIAEEGEAHSREFTVECQVSLLNETVIARGKNKRSAEQSVARLILDLIEERS